MDEGELRALFPGTRDLVYLDAAARSLLPQPVLDAVTAVLERQRDRGSVGSTADLEAIETTRRSAARLLHARPEEIALLPNTTEGIARVAAGLDWRDGDQVVLGDLEFPANVFPWAAQWHRGARLVVVRSENGRLEAGRLVDAIGERTRVVAVSWVQAGSGYRLDLEELSRACQERGVLLAVDAIQGLGVLPIDVERLKVGALTSDGRKWLMGPAGAGILYVAPEWVERIAPRGPGADSVVAGLESAPFGTRLAAEGRLDLSGLYRRGAGRYESGFWNVAGIAGLGAALDLAEGIGRDTIRARVASLVDRLARGLESIGLPVHGPRTPEERAGIVAFEVRGSVERVHASLTAQGIALSVRGGRLRASPHVYNTAGEVDALLDRLRRPGGG